MSTEIHFQLFQKMIKKKKMWAPSTHDDTGIILTLIYISLVKDHT